MNPPQRLQEASTLLRVRLDTLILVELCTERLTFSLNYRNSREIASYFTDHVSALLPHHFTMEIPLFETLPVFEQIVRTEPDAMALTRQIIDGLRKEYAESEIAVITFFSQGLRIRMTEYLRQLGINAGHRHNGENCTRSPYSILHMIGPGGGEISNSSFLRVLLR